MWLRHDKIRMERIATLLVAHLQTAQANTLTKFAKEPPSQHTTDKERMKEQRGITLSGLKKPNHKREVP